MDRIIMHMDLDAFFASCEEIRDPSLKNKPVIIGADPKKGKGRGVVSTANYLARKYGIHSGMPISWAYARCKHGVFISGGFNNYSAISRKIFSYVANLGYTFQKAGIDEGYMDLSGLSLIEVEKIVSKIKNFLKNEVGVTASFGIGPNKLIAKVSSDYKKPNGITVVGEDEVLKFLNPLPVKKIPGIGPKSQVRLKELGVEKISDLQGMSDELLIHKFGKSYGAWLYRVSRGEDNRQIGVNRETKSIGAERTFLIDVGDKAKVFERLNELSEKIFKRMDERGFTSSTLVLKVRYQGFETHTVQRTINQEFTDVAEVCKVAKALVRPFLCKKKIRLIGIRFTGLSKKKRCVQLKLFV